MPELDDRKYLEPPDDPEVCEDCGEVHGRGKCSYWMDILADQQGDDARLNRRA